MFKGYCFKLEILDYLDRINQPFDSDYKNNLISFFKNIAYTNLIIYQKWKLFQNRITYLASQVKFLLIRLI